MKHNFLPKQQMDFDYVSDSTGFQHKLIQLYNDTAVSFSYNMSIQTFLKETSNQQIPKIPTFIYWLYRAQM